MAKGRTVAAIELTGRDRWALRVCTEIGESLASLITSESIRKEFVKEYGKVDMSRDSGVGLAGGKLQRDALCTRGRTGKAPYSNRNLRWHPLTIAARTPDYAEEVDAITLDGDTLVFVIEGELWYPNQVHTLPKPYCAPLAKWYAVKDELSRDSALFFGLGCSRPLWHKAKTRFHRDLNFNNLELHPTASLAALRHGHLCGQRLQVKFQIVKVGHLCRVPG